VVSYVGVYNGSVSLYLNNIVVDADAGAGLITEVMGAHSILEMMNSLARDMNGIIDEVRIYNRSLDATKVQNLYELGSYHLMIGVLEF